MTSPSAYLGTAEGNAWLQEKFTNRALWMALNHDDPTPLADPSTEVLGGGYVRQPIVFGAPSSKTAANTNSLIYEGMPATTIYWVSIWDDQFGGRMVQAIRQTSGQSVAAGGQYLAAPGDVVVGLA